LKKDSSKRKADSDYYKQKKEANIRRHKKTILFNDKELEALDTFCDRYKVKSKTKFCREAIIATILKQFEEDHPRLF